MSEKTMRKWFKTFLMLLPFLFLAIFAISVRKDGLRYAAPQPPYEIYDTGIQYEELSISEDELIVPVEEMIDEVGYWYLSYSATDVHIAAENGDGYIILGEFNTFYNTILRLNLDDYSIEFSDDGEITPTFTPMFPQSLDEYVDYINLDEIIWNNIIDIIEYGTDSMGSNEVQMAIYVEFNPGSNVQDRPLYFNFENADIRPTVLKDRAQETIYIEGPQAVLLHFNDMIEENFNLNAFGMNDFYNWMNENWFNYNAPLIVKPVFTLLVYEAIIELIFLMFSFITFVIRYAQQWIDGVYSKGGGK